MKWEYNPQNKIWIKSFFNTDHWGASIVKMEPGSCIHPTSLETDGEYHEFSLWLRRPKSGGHFFLRFMGKCYFRPDRLIYWQPDMENAEISKVTEGIGYLFNFGWRTNLNKPLAQAV